MAKPSSVVAPAYSSCAAVDANTYAGAGVGVWQNINATASAVDMPISIDGLKGQDVTLVLAARRRDACRSTPSAGRRNSDQR